MNIDLKCIVNIIQLPTHVFRIFSRGLWQVFLKRLSYSDRACMHLKLEHVRTHCLPTFPHQTLTNVSDSYYTSDVHNGIQTSEMPIPSHRPIDIAKSFSSGIQQGADGWTPRNEAMGNGTTPLSLHYLLCRAWWASICLMENGRK